MVLHNGTVRELDQLTARVFTGRTPCVRLDAHPDGDGFVVDIDLPRPGRADVQVSADEDALTVRASSRDAGEPARSDTREVVLSETLDADRLDAHYDRGELTVRIPVIPRKRRIAAAA